MMVRPFSNGSQYADWQARNCNRCAKYNPERYDGACDIDGALGIAYIGTGTVPDDIARRMGYLDNQDAFTWDCPERQEPTSST